MFPESVLSPPPLKGGGEKTVEYIAQLLSSIAQLLSILCYS
jgi:hypothetical protein